MFSQKEHYLILGLAEKKAAEFGSRRETNSLVCVSQKKTAYVKSHKEQIISFGFRRNIMSLGWISQRTNQLILGLAETTSTYCGSRTKLNDLILAIAKNKSYYLGSRNIDYDGLRGKGLWATQQTRNCHMLRFLSV